MFNNSDLDTIIEDQEKKIKELAIRNETLDRKEKEFLEELGVRHEQLTKFIAEKSHFTEKNWNEMQHEKRKLENKLQTELDNIRNLKKAKQAFKERNIGKHWIFIR